MSLSTYEFPFHVENNKKESVLSLSQVVDVFGRVLCDNIYRDDARQVCDILNSHFAKKEEPVKDTSPTPNQAETDRVAMEFIKSGRKLTVQYLVELVGWVDYVIIGSDLPTFNKERAWRIKPQKRRVVVDLFLGPISKNMIGYERESNPWKELNMAGTHKRVGTIEGEVEV